MNLSIFLPGKCNAKCDFCFQNKEYKKNGNYSAAL
jgi:sulfatase maturation enzyme AslB (radical SAM superfamily)